MASLNTNGQDARQSGASSQFVVDSTGTDSQCARGRIVSSAASSTRPEGTSSTISMPSTSFPDTLGSSGQLPGLGPYPSVADPAKEPQHPLPQKKSRTQFTPKQLFYLEEKFLENQFPNFKERVAISKELDLTQHHVQIWFQNRRAKDRRKKKRQRLEPPAVQAQQPPPSWPANIPFDSNLAKSGISAGAQRLSSKAELDVPSSSELYQQQQEEVEEASEHLQEEIGSVGTATTTSSQTGSTGAMSPSLSMEQRSPASEQLGQSSPLHKSMPPTALRSSPKSFHSPPAPPAPNPLGLPEDKPPSCHSSYTSTHYRSLSHSSSSTVHPSFGQAVSLAEHPQIPQAYMEQPTYHLPPEEQQPHSLARSLAEQQVYLHTCSPPILAEPPVPLFDIMSEIPHLSASLIESEQSLPPCTMHLPQPVYSAPQGPCTSVPVPFSLPQHLSYPHSVYHSPVPSAASYGSPSPPNLFSPLSPSPTQLRPATMAPLASLASHPFSYPTSVQDPTQGGYHPEGFIEGLLDQQSRFYPPHAVHPSHSAQRMPASLPRASNQVHRASRPPPGL